jgi:MFS family permease
MALAESSAQYVVGFGLLAAAYGLGLVLAAAEITSTTAMERRGFALGVQQSLGVISLVASAVMNGFVFDRFGPAAPMLAAEVMLFIFAIVWTTTLYAKGVRRQLSGSDKAAAAGSAP